MLHVCDGAVKGAGINSPRVRNPRVKRITIAAPVDISAGEVGFAGELVSGQTTRTRLYSVRVAVGAALIACVLSFWWRTSRI